MNLEMESNLSWSIFGRKINKSIGKKMSGKKMSDINRDT